MNKHTDGGPAFPSAQPLGERFYADIKGMSLRDYFAGQALTGIVAIIPSLKTEAQSYAYIATKAYEMADSMLRARAAQSPAERQAAHLEEFGK